MDCLRDFFKLFYRPECLKYFTRFFALVNSSDSSGVSANTPGANALDKVCSSAWCIPAGRRLCWLHGQWQTQHGQIEVTYQFQIRGVSGTTVSWYYPLFWIHHSRREPRITPWKWAWSHCLYNGWCRIWMKFYGNPRTIYLLWWHIHMFRWWALSSLPVMPAVRVLAPQHVWIQWLDEVKCLLDQISHI